ncbi:TetR/AcrR family transcriptional regulator [Xanthobacter sp. DSM 24535]|uniref:TetR/AcrR family transcriptional regulator n=1 Tax=Roseixanthobacter psychrophilus TaxID=3119917 RepID=UPI00372A80BE
MEAERRRRADALANRDRILDVARATLTADPDASLSAIAKAAGVGQGTLYRHFPTREALVLDVYRREIDEIVTLAGTLLAEHPPLRSFQLWCERLAEFGRVKHAVADMLHAAISDNDIHETYWPMVGAVRQLLEACEGSGEIRSGSDAEDVLTLLSVLGTVPSTSVGKARANRLIALVFLGLGAESLQSADSANTGTGAHSSGRKVE